MKEDSFIVKLTYREASGKVNLGNNTIIDAELLQELLREDGFTIEHTGEFGIIKASKKLQV